MVQAAVAVVQAGGVDSLTAKALAAKLGTSTQPVFTCFGTMEALKLEVYKAAEQIFDGYAAAGLRHKVPFFGYGMQYIRFAREESELYSLLFLNRRPPKEQNAMNAIVRSLERVRPVLMQVYAISAEQAGCYFRDVWLAAHGIAALIVTGNCPYDDAEIARILTGCSLGILKAIKEIPGFSSGSFNRDELFKDMIH